MRVRVGFIYFYYILYTLWIAIIFSQVECGWDVCVVVCALMWGGNPMGESSDGGVEVFLVSPVVWRVRLCK